MAQALVKAQRSSPLPPSSPASAAPANASTATKKTWDSTALDQKMADMEHRIEARMEVRWDDMQSKLDRILAAISG